MRRIREKMNVVTPHSDSGEPREQEMASPIHLHHLRDLIISFALLFFYFKTKLSHFIQKCNLSGDVHRTCYNEFALFFLQTVCVCINVHRTLKRLVY